MKRFKDYFFSLYRDKQQVVLLTWIYSAIALIFVVIAALVYLANQPAGAALLIVPLVAIASLCMNVVFYTLVTAILGPIAKKKPAKKSTKKKTTRKKATKKHYYFC